MQPMPSPNGTNFAQRYLPWSNPTMAMDAAMPRQPKRMFHSIEEAAAYGTAYARRNMAFDARLPPENVEKMLRFLSRKLSPEDLAQVEGIANTDDDPTHPSAPAPSKPIHPTTHGGDPAAPGYGGSKDYAGLRAQAERDNDSLNRRDEQDPSAKNPEKRVAMDSGRKSSSYDTMFPEASKIALDSWSGTQAVPRAAPMSVKGAASYNAMFPDAKRIERA